MVHARFTPGVRRAPAVEADRCRNQNAFDADRRDHWRRLAGLSIGLGAAIWYTQTHRGTSTLVPSMDIGAGRTVLSYGGSF